jgi:hypothetical protein
MLQVDVVREWAGDLERLYGAVGDDEEELSVAKAEHRLRDVAS